MNQPMAVLWEGATDEDEMPAKKTSPGAALARERWKHATEEDRAKSRAAGALGGRPATCECGECAVCVRRERDQRRREASA